jgi:hypothetical protein
LTVDGNFNLAIVKSYLKEGKMIVPAPTAMSVLPPKIV